MPRTKASRRHTILHRIELDSLELLRSHFGEQEAAVYSQWHRGMSIKAIRACSQLSEVRINQIIRNVEQRLERCFAPHRLQMLLEFQPENVITRDVGAILRQLDTALTKVACLCADNSAKQISKGQILESSPATTPIETLGLSTRSSNVLYMAGARSVEDVCGLTKTDILSVRNCGNKTITEIMLSLQQRGLGLAETEG